MQRASTVPVVLPPPAAATFSPATSGSDERVVAPSVVTPPAAAVSGAAATSSVVYNQWLQRKREYDAAHEDLRRTVSTQLAQQPDGDVCQVRKELLHRIGVADSLASAINGRVADADLLLSILREHITRRAEELEVATKCPRFIIALMESHLYIQARIMLYRYCGVAAMYEEVDSDAVTEPLGEAV